MKQKQEIVAKIYAGMPKDKIAQDYNFGQSNVADIYKNKEKTTMNIDLIKESNLKLGLRL